MPVQEVHEVEVVILDESKSVNADVKKNIAEARGHYNVEEHQMSSEDVANRYETRVDWSQIPRSQGLNETQVTKLRAEHGLNQLMPPKDLPEVLKLLKQVLNPLMLLLLLAGGLMFMAYGVQKPYVINNLIMAIALVVLVLMTCMMTYIQEKSASDVMNSLKRMMPNTCSVYRDGKEMKVAASELVPGDLVRLYIGDRVPADMRIIESTDLKVECSSLTGESDLVSVHVECMNDIPEHSQCLVFMSTLCMNGEGHGIVVRTGDNTFIGKIASLAGSTVATKSTLQIEVYQLVKFIGTSAFIMGICFFSIGLGRGFDPIIAFINGFIIVIVANVPEGLPATVTSLLSLTAMRLKEKNILIKRTDIIENLGCASIIASDKTGTLTQNKMTVENIWCNCELTHASQIIPLQAPCVSGVSGNRGLGTTSTSLAKSSRPINRASRRIQDIVTERADAVHHSLVELATTSKMQLPSTLEDETLEAGLPSLKTVSKMDADMPSLVTVSRMAIGRTSVGTTGEDGRMQYKPSLATKSRGLMAQSCASDACSPRPSEIPDTPRGSAKWQSNSGLARLAIIATVCNKARFSSSPTESDAEAQAQVAMAQGSLSMDNRVILGDATDSGLLRYCDRLAQSSAIRSMYNVVFSIPFNSASKWALSVTECPGSLKEHVVMMKGAPEIVLTKCSHYFKNGQEHSIDAEFSVQMQAAYERCGFLGERVLGFAAKTIVARDPESYKAEGRGPPTDGLVFMGLISLVDPPRAGVLQAVHKCRTAGVRVAMVTGDHPLTAEAIARKVGIVTLKTPREVAAELDVPEDEVPLSHPMVGAVIVPGSRLRQITMVEEWDKILDHEEVVFARTSPQQKLQIVENLQRRGEVVAVTGDGVNDSPALKRAQIGVAMGVGGSDVAREAADIVLMDDDFPSIVNAIEEGRIIFDNLKKTIVYTLTHIVPEIWPIFLNLALSFPLALSGLLILLAIDLVTEQGPAISLAYEHAEDNIMERPPRDVLKDRLISGPAMRYAYLIAGLVQAGFSTLAFFVTFWFYGVNVADLLWSQDSKASWFVIPASRASPYPSTKPCASPDGTDLGNGQTCQGSTIHYDGHKQYDIYCEAQSAYFLTVVMSQFWHIWMCKTRQVSIFKHGLFKNPVTIYGTFIAVTVALIIIYVPNLWPIFLTRSLSGFGWLPNLGFLAVMLIFTEITKFIARNRPESWWSRNIAW